MDIEAYEVWAYSTEIILLNGSILLGCLLISFMLGEMTHMLSFVLFFIPLRMLVGGYHCRKGAKRAFLHTFGIWSIYAVYTVA
ncbi:MAG: accessory gene regulator B family protein [Eubacterium sp.]